MGENCRGCGTDQNPCGFRADSSPVQHARSEPVEIEDDRRNKEDVAQDIRSAIGRFFS
jgi:hypothetical protein